MTVEDVREYELKQQAETNQKVSSGLQGTPPPLRHVDSTDSTGSADEFTLASEELPAPGSNSLDTEID